MNDTVNVLIIRLGAIGDIVHTLPLLCQLHDKLPDHRFSWLVKEQFADLLRGHPCLQEVHTTVDHGRRYDLCIDAQGLLKSAIAARCLGKRSVGLHPSRELLASYIWSDRVPSTPVKSNNKHVIYRTLDLLSYFCIEADGHIEFRLPVDDHEDMYGWLGSGYTVISPHTSWQSKNWSHDHWNQLIDLLIDDGRMVVVLGTGDPMPLRDHPSIADLQSRTTLSQLKYIISRAGLVICGDSGILHVATALAKPRVGLFGATAVSRTGSLGADVSASRACVPCHRRTCAYATAAMQTSPCMDSISPEQIMQHIRQSIV